ncbi:hypothetical protein BU15DRAFT_60352 [Melanogaster broomeanus]|nr:hypothetical protein BU15DRAFT_60352 [Melanogaster broomeanus]
MLSSMGVLGEVGGDSRRRRGRGVECIDDNENHQHSLEESGYICPRLRERELKTCPPYAKFGGGDRQGFSREHHRVGGRDACKPGSISGDIVFLVAWAGMWREVVIWLEGAAGAIVFVCSSLAYQIVMGVLKLAVAVLAKSLTVDLFGLIARMRQDSARFNYRYDNDKPSMCAIFVAHGSFSHGTKALSSIPGSTQTQPPAWHSVTGDIPVIGDAYVMPPAFRQCRGIDPRHATTKHRGMGRAYE